MKFFLLLPGLFFYGHVSAQVTTQTEYQFLINGVKMHDEMGAVFSLKGYSLNNVSTATTDNVMIDLRRLIRTTSGKTAGYSIKTTFSKPYAAPIVNYFGYPAKNSGGTESYGWGLFYQAMESTVPEVQRALIRWFAKNLAEKL